MLRACTVLAMFPVGEKTEICLRSDLFEGEVIYTKVDEGGHYKYLVEFTDPTIDPGCQGGARKRSVPVPPLVLRDRIGWSTQEEPALISIPRMNPEDQSAANERLEHDPVTQMQTGIKCNLHLRLGIQKDPKLCDAKHYDAAVNWEHRMQGGNWVAILDGIPRGFGENFAEKWKNWSAGITCFQKSLDKHAGNEYGLITYWKDEDCWVVEYWFRDGLNRDNWAFRTLYEWAGRGGALMQFQKKEPYLRTYSEVITTKEGKKFMLPLFGSKKTPASWVPCGRTRIYHKKIGSRKNVYVVEK